MTARKLVTKARCVVCNHADRALIEFARVAGCSLDSIAAKHNISRDASNSNPRRKIDRSPARDRIYQRRDGQHGREQSDDQ